MGHSRHIVGRGTDNAKRSVVGKVKERGQTHLPLVVEQSQQRRVAAARIKVQYQSLRRILAGIGRSNDKSLLAEDKAPCGGFIACAGDAVLEAIAIMRDLVFTPGLGKRQHYIQTELALA